MCGQHNAPGALPVPGLEPATRDPPRIDSPVRYHLIHLYLPYFYEKDRKINAIIILFKILFEVVFLSGAMSNIFPVKGEVGKTSLGC